MRLRIGKDILPKPGAFLGARGAQNQQLGVVMQIQGHSTNPGGCKITVLSEGLHLGTPQDSHVRGAERLEEKQLVLHPALVRATGVLAAMLEEGVQFLVQLCLSWRKAVCYELICLTADVRRHLTIGLQEAAMLGEQTQRERVFPILLKLQGRLLHSGRVPSLLKDPLLLPAECPHQKLLNTMPYLEKQRLVSPHQQWQLQIVNM
mmetsp:Transcript_16642/g.39525  ORF Transcript_16642/g.39525 Transcript_16642/m.39525 type:complete len:205 (+) Transcript_16642:114-728(+)